LEKSFPASDFVMIIFGLRVQFFFFGGGGLQEQMCWLAADWKKKANITLLNIAKLD